MNESLDPAEVRGVNLHARQCVDGRDRRQIERLCRYITRPPLAQYRLELRPDGKLELTLKNVWKDGTRAILLEPRDLIIRLIAAISPPRFHLVRYFGVLSSHSRFRSEVIPKPPQNSAAFKPPPASGDQLEFPKLNAQTDDSRPSRKRWAWLLAHVFRADLDTCVHCGGPMRWLEAATTEQAATASWPSLGLLLSLLRRHHGFCQGSSGSSSVEGLKPGSCCPWGAARFAGSEHVRAEIYRCLHNVPQLGRIHRLLCLLCFGDVVRRV